MVRRRSFASVGLLLLAATGCASKDVKGPAATAAPQLAPFRAPSEIRPDNSSIQPAHVTPPTPAAVAVKPTPSRQISGAWAPPVKSRPWKYIVLHHSASPSGNAMLFDREHREKGWDELGYHFVIDNGRGGADGNIEIGPRWQKQKYGAHAKTPDNRFNDFGIGICFVGNFETGKPTAKQLASSQRLVAWLMQTYDIPATNILGHEDTGRSTLCPGKFLSVAQVRTLAQRTLADAGFPAVTIDGEDPVAHAQLETLPADRELLQSR